MPEDGLFVDSYSVVTDALVPSTRVVELKTTDCK